MSAIDVISTIADDVATSGAQRKAAIAAMTRLQDLTLQGEREDTPAAPKLVVNTDFLVFVLNGQGSTEDEVRNMRGIVSQLAARGSVTVVTVGRMGVEIQAMRIAAAVKARHIEVGCVWQTPMPDGSTRRNPAARNQRNKVVRELTEQYVASGVGKCAVLRYGTESSSDALEGLLVKAGAVARKSSPLYRAPVPAVAEEVPGVDADVKLSLEA